MRKYRSAVSCPPLVLRVAALSMVVCRRHMAAYSCPKSRHTYTQPQLMTCLVLKAYLKQGYRAVCEILAVSDGLRAALGLETVPHFTALKKFADRAVEPGLVDGLLGTILKEARGPGAPDEPAAMDATGMDPQTASSHFRAKRDKAGKGAPGGGGYVKVSVLVTCVSLLAVSLTVAWGPRADLADAPALLARAYGRVRPTTLYGDAGYDAEWVHRWCQDRWHVRSVIKPVIRSADGQVKTRRRREMLPLPRDRGKRWAVESFFSGLKRSCGDKIWARSQPAKFTEAALRVLAYTLRR